MAEDRRGGGVIPLERQPSRLSGFYDFVTRSNSSLNLSGENGVVEGSFVETCLKNHKLRNLPIDRSQIGLGRPSKALFWKSCSQQQPLLHRPSRRHVVDRAGCMQNENVGTRRPSQPLIASGMGLDTPMYPTLESYAHFHYEHIHFPKPVVFAVPQCTRLETVQDKYGMSHKVFTVIVTSGDTQWKIRRTFSQCQNLDAQIHHCMHSRAYTKLPDLCSIKMPESTLPQVEQKRKILHEYMENLQRFMNPSPKVGCTAVLSWLQLDNTGERLRHCRASDELALNMNDMVAIIDMPDPEVSIWWRGKNNSKSGFFPYTCVEMIAQQKAPERGMISAGDETNSRAIGAALVVSPYTAQNPGELTLTVGELISLISAPPDQPLWKGKANSFMSGAFPRECVKILTKTEIQDVDLAEARFHDYPSPFSSQSEMLSNPSSNNSSTYQPPVSIVRSGSDRDKEKGGGAWNMMRKMSRQGSTQSLPMSQGPTTPPKNDGNMGVSGSPSGSQSKRKASLQPKLATLFGGAENDSSASTSSSGGGTVSDRTHKNDRAEKLVDPNSAGGLMRRVGGIFGGRPKPDEKPPGVFGAELGEYLERTGQRLPLVVTACVEEIEHRGPMEGLYRAGGSIKEANALKAAFEKDDRAVDVKAVDDVHVLAGTVKAYFRELPTPLLTYGLYPAFMTAGTSIEALHGVIMQLPPPHLRLLHYLLRHLLWVTSNKTQTLMDSRALAIVWTPNVLRAPTESTDVSNSNYYESHKYVFETLINGVDNVDLFGPELATI